MSSSPTASHVVAPPPTTTVPSSSPTPTPKTPNSPSLTTVASTTLTTKIPTPTATTSIATPTTTRVPTPTTTATTSTIIQTTANTTIRTPLTTNVIDSPRHLLPHQQQQQLHHLKKKVHHNGPFDLVDMSSPTHTNNNNNNDNNDDDENHENHEHHHSDEEEEEAEERHFRASGHGRNDQRTKVVPTTTTTTTKTSNLHQTRKNKKNRFSFARLMKRHNALAPFRALLLHYRKTLIALLMLMNFLGGCTYGINLSVIAGVLGPIQAEYPSIFRSDRSPIAIGFLVGLISSCYVFGGIFGAMMGGWLGNLFGRKVSGIVAALFNILGSVLSAVSPEFWFLNVCRFLVGIGSSASLVSPPTMMAEVSFKYFPKRAGIIGNSTQLGINTGLLLGYVICLAFMDVIYDWRFMFAMSNITGVPFLIVMCIVPESPVWIDTRLGEDGDDDDEQNSVPSLPASSSSSSLSSSSSHEAQQVTQVTTTSSSQVSQPPPPPMLQIIPNVVEAVATIVQDESHQTNQVNNGGGSRNSSLLDAPSHIQVELDDLHSGHYAHGAVHSRNSSIDSDAGLLSVSPSLDFMEAGNHHHNGSRNSSLDLPHGARTTSQELLDQTTGPNNNKKTDKKAKLSFGQVLLQLFCTRRNAVRYFVGLTCVIALTWLGLNAILFYITDIFKSAGLSGRKDPMIASVALGGWMVVVTILAPLGDVIGRKPVLMSGVGLMTISCLTLGFLLHYVKDPTAKGYSAIAVIAVYYAGFNGLFGGNYIPYLNELFPPELSMVAVTTFLFFQWSLNFVLGLVFLPIVSAVGQAAAFWFFGVVGFVCFVIMAIFMPETKQGESKLKKLFCLVVCCGRRRGTSSPSEVTPSPAAATDIPAESTKDH